MNASFLRKIVYLVLMAILLVPLYWLSAPSFHKPTGQRSPGGLLTQVREEFGLSQSNLGDIDPASESMKLATLGMRGVAANLLWGRANEYKKKEQWDNLRATLNQIAKLQPNFISVWQFQAWNLSYNVSVEFDNYKHRYHWVKKGIDFLMQGITYNRDEPRLLWDLGWFFGHKVGRSDEYRQFRREYRKDGDFHDTLPIDVEAAKDYNLKPDNWLTAHEWFLQAQRSVDLEGVPIKGKNPLVFHSDPAKSLIRYADAIEEEGKFGDVAALAWRRADAAWKTYGDRDIPTSYGYKIRLNEGERWTQRVEDRNRELETFLPGLKEEIKQARWDQLSSNELAVLDRPRVELEAEEYEVAINAESKLEVTPQDIADAAPPEKRREAKRLANRVIEANAYSTTIRRYRDVVNWQYWKTRSEVEQTDQAVEAREYLWNAAESYREADLVGAKEEYEEAWKRWATIHNEHPILADDVTAEDLVAPIKTYRRLLGQLDEVEFPPKGFPMLKLVANYAEEFGFTNDEAQAMLNEALNVEHGHEHGEDGHHHDGPHTEDNADTQARDDDDGATSDENADIEPVAEQESGDPSRSKSLGTPRRQKLRRRKLGPSQSTRRGRTRSLQAMTRPMTPRPKNRLA